MLYLDEMKVKEKYRGIERKKKKKNLFPQVCFGCKEEVKGKKLNIFYTFNLLLFFNELLSF